MKLPITKIYDGANLAGATPNVIYMPVIYGGSVREMILKTDEAVAGANALFTVTKNGVNVPALSAVMLVGSKIVIISGLTTLVAQNDELVLHLSSGNVSSPLSWTLEIEDFELRGLPSRADTIVTTAALADLEVETGTVALGRSFNLLKLVVTRYAWVRLYSTSAARFADAGRAINTDIAAGTEHGLIAEFILDAITGLSWDCSPSVIGSNADSPISSNIYYSIQNRSGAAGTVGATFTHLILEV